MCVLYLQWIKSPFYLLFQWHRGLLLTFLFTMGIRKDNDRFIALLVADTPHQDQ
jgi:hypothetical protein